MVHRHLTLERYELALEVDAAAAVRLRRRAEGCAGCAAELAQPPLAPALAAWALPQWADRPAAWRGALRRAVAPSAQAPRRRGQFRRMPLALAAALVAALLVVTALPAAATADPSSPLYPARGALEDARWEVTPQDDRTGLEADLASAYIWQARTSAARHDAGGYDAAMQRFFKWASRLKADVARASPDKRSIARDSVQADRSLLSPLTSAGPDSGQARRAESVIDEVQAESEGGGGRHDSGHAPGSGSQVQQPDGRDGS